jgi:hypothetical protein
MNKYIKLIAVFVGIWFIASLINGVISIVTIGLFENNNADIYFVMPASFIFSIPFVSFTWFITMIACMFGYIGEKLYQTVLHASFFIGIGAAIFFKLWMDGFIEQFSVVISIGIVISAVSATIIFRKKLKSII